MSYARNQQFSIIPIHPYMPNSRLEALVALAENGVIGREQTIPWRLKEDLMRFKRITMGHSLLMGRKTFESIGRPLPGRKTWVLSRQTDLEIPGCQVISDWKVALDSLGPDEKLFLVGGAEIYRQLLPLCAVLHITHVFGEVAGDAHLDPIPTLGYELVESKIIPQDENNQFESRYERWVFDESK